MRQKSDYRFIIIGLNPGPEKLKKLIKTRLEKRLKNGLISEVKNLHEQEKLSWKRLESLGLDYRFVALYLQKKLTKQELVEKLNTAIWHYAKRQLTWWKRDARVRWQTRKQALRLQLKSDNIDTKRESRSPEDKRRQARQ